MDTKNARRTENFRDIGRPTVESIFGEDWQRRNPMDMVLSGAPDFGPFEAPSPRSFQPNWDPEGLRQSLYYGGPVMLPEPAHPFADLPARPVQPIPGLRGRTR